jgi:hypothetical protein
MGFASTVTQRFGYFALRDKAANVTCAGQYRDPYSAQDVPTKEAHQSSTVNDALRFSAHAMGLGSLRIAAIDGNEITQSSSRLFTP